MIEKKINYKSEEDMFELKKFLDSNPNGTKNFRYFEKRPFDVLKNHIFTGLYYKDNILLGYGHLDYDSDKIWLGIIVSDENQSKGHGNNIIDSLISKTKKNIHLSVDKENIKARKLYEKKGFEIIKENENNFIMIKKNK